VDHKREGTIIGRELETDAGAAAGCVAGDGARPLVNPRLAQVEARLAQGQLNAGGIGAWCKNEIEFQFAPVPVIDHVDARIDAPKTNATVVGNINAPLA